METLHIHINVPGDRATVLDRRDQLVEKLTEAGLRLSLTDAGLDVYMVDGDVPTFFETMVERAQERAGHGPS